MGSLGTLYLTPAGLGDSRECTFPIISWSDGYAIGGNSSGGGGNISSHSSPHGNVNASPTGGGLVQQLLPLRLSESLEHKRASPKVPSSTDYLNDFYGSIQIQTQFEQFQSTGQQNCRFCCRLQPNGKQSSFYSDAQPKTSSLPHNNNNNNIVSASAGSMHPPKISDKPASLLL